MFGVMDVVNLAHGDLPTVAGYIGVGIVAVSRLPFLWSVPVVVAIMAVLGYLLQRTIIPTAISRGELTTLIVTFGLSIVIENGLLQFFTSSTRGLGVGDSFETASFSIGSQITIAWLDVYIFVLAVAVLLALPYFLSGSKYGRLIRAVADDREAAQLSGGGLPARVRHRRRDRLRHGGAGRNVLRPDRDDRPDHGHRRSCSSRSPRW